MVRMFLVTANVGSVFDNLEHGLPVWLQQFCSVVRSRDPEFVAIHFQETGGKGYEDATASITEFYRQLVEKMEHLNFRVAEGFVDSAANLEDQFTALSSIYFVHESHRQPVHIWDFQEGKFHEVACTLTPVASNKLHSSIHIGYDLQETGRKQKEKFPQNFYPNCKWSRKGFIRTRWRFGGSTVDLVNVHLFHDSCNLIAASAFPSQFAQLREKTLKYTLERIQADSVDASPLFIFGDFNFRTNAFGVLNVLKQEFGDPVTKVNEESQLIYASKKFQCPNQEERFKNDYEWLKEYDFETQNFSELLLEHDLNFHPTYPFEEDEAIGEKYLRTRMPSWCDRVLFSPSAKQLFAKDFPIEYNLIGGNVCMGDHKPVVLCVKLNTAEDSNCCISAGDVKIKGNCLETRPAGSSGCFPCKLLRCRDSPHDAKPLGCGFPFSKRKSDRPCGGSFLVPLADADFSLLERPSVTGLGVDPSEISKLSEFVSAPPRGKRDKRRLLCGQCCYQADKPSDLEECHNQTRLMLNLTISNNCNTLTNNRNLANSNLSLIAINTNELDKTKMNDKKNLADKIISEETPAIEKFPVCWVKNSDPCQCPGDKLSRKVSFRRLAFRKNPSTSRIPVARCKCDCHLTPKPTGCCSGTKSKCVIL